LTIPAAAAFAAISFFVIELVSVIVAGRLKVHSSLPAYSPSITAQAFKLMPKIRPNHRRDPDIARA